MTRKYWQYSSWADNYSDWGDDLHNIIDDNVDDSGYVL